MKDDQLYLRDIKERIQRIESYTSDGFEAFMQNLMIQDAVLRNLEVIGEATKRLSSKFRESCPEVEWQKIAGLRDVLIHEYGKVNLLRVWGVIEQNLPDLKQKIENLLQQFDSDN